ncbi:MAG TPA: DUF475 domain-containing protein [Anaeromyxobacteraceae bacterium]|nr:DUF475 domain-containing protein [Anaeromyxobacteraceae bacterium]
MSKTLSYFTGSFVVTAVGLILGAGVGLYYERTLAGTVETVFIVAVLAVLETSLSFDNAVVNATVMRDMTQLWRRRFLTWGMAIAVFGMRFVFPLVVVSAVASIGPIEALRLAAFEPLEYARLLKSAHVALGAFGGTFLAMVCLKFFFDADKEVHWLGHLEAALSRLGKFEAMALGLMMLATYGFSLLVPEHEARTFLVSGIFGLVTFIGVDAVGTAMEVDTSAQHDLHRAGLAGFLYLNVLDATFSFDGVIGAFALTNNLFVIAIGLGIGAMFVRSLTIMLVERGTLEAYRYLEHGAFYAVGALGLLMMAGTVVEVPQAVTGLLGGGFIGLAFLSSLRYSRARRREKNAQAA